MTIFCWSASFILVSTASYNYLNADLKFNSLLVHIGASVMLFCAGLLPKTFFISLKLTLSSTMKPLLLSPKSHLNLTYLGIFITATGIVLQTLRFNCF
ncbi:hypothetical protein [Shewanella kaireitica]|uniref:hypothetical protein n=1 Tax=Shewanella kaireitica TaxID=212021 RepID=UPI00200EA994|nr:hypothetical protein [Shewanella kaireitica]MCL1093709.1 hypothetical protein [Shewanella kaireitica]